MPQINWYKNTTRTNEVKTLMQGLSLPSTSDVSHTPLPPPQPRPTELPPPPKRPHIFTESADTLGQARVRGSATTAGTVTTTTAGTITCTIPTTTTTITTNTSMSGDNRNEIREDSTAESLPIQPPQPTAVTPSAVVATPSRTTLWRQRKRAEAGACAGAREYTCRMCGKPMNKSK